MRKLRPHEEAFTLHPVGIRYRCEFCNEGEMIASSELETIVLTDPPQLPYLHKHVCNKCGKEMMLPHKYPYIEWLGDNEYEEYCKSS